MHRNPINPFRGILEYGQSFIGAMSGLAMLSQGLMTDLQFRGLDRGYKGRRSIDRSRYTPAGPRRNCGERGISPKLLRRRAVA